MLRSERRESHAAGWAEGHAEGRAEALCTSALLVLESRGMAVSASLSERLAKLEGVSEHLGDTALACRDEDDFLHRLLARR